MKLEELGADDEVILSGGWSGIESIQVIERTTKTQIVIKGRGKFNRVSGWAVGDSGYSRSFISVKSPEEMAKIKLAATKRRLINDIDGLDLSKLEIDQLRDMLKIALRTNE